MDFQGKVIQFLGETSGTSKTGNLWKKKEWVVETFGQYPKKVKLQCMNARADAINLEPGLDYTFYIDLESREFNGRWYTDASVYRADPYNAQQNFGGQPQQGGYQQQAQPGFSNPAYGGSQPPYGSGQPFSPSVEESDEDLPF